MSWRKWVFDNAGTILVRAKKVTSRTHSSCSASTTIEDDDDANSGSCQF